MEKDKKYQKFLEQEARKEKYQKLKKEKDATWEKYRKLEKEMEDIIPPKVVHTRGDPCVEIF